MKKTNERTTVNMKISSTQASESAVVSLLSACASAADLNLWVERAEFHLWLSLINIFTCFFLLLCCRSLYRPVVTNFNQHFQLLFILLIESHPSNVTPQHPNFPGLRSHFRLLSLPPFSTPHLFHLAIFLCFIYVRRCWWLGSAQKEEVKKRNREKTRAAAAARGKNVLISSFD